MHSRSRLKTSALTFSLVLAAFGAACGPPPPAEPPPAPTVAPSVEPAPSAAPSAPVSVAPTAAPSSAPTVAPVALPPGMPATNAPLSSTKYDADLKRLGIDPTKPIADLEKLDLGTKKKLMPLFQKALGYESCTGCHAANGDYHTSTRNMKIARKMWSQFVGALREEKGGLVFCDSCHNGAAKILNRTDKKAVAKFMDEGYVHRLTRKDQQPNGCATCHGEGVEPKIIEKIWGIAAK